MQLDYPRTELQAKTYWPQHLWPLADTIAWIQENVNSSSPAIGPMAIYHEKDWGITATFECGGELFVFKGCTLSLFAQRVATEQLLAHHCATHVPALVATRTLPNQATWTLHRHVEGLAVAESRALATIQQLARVIAKIQTIIGALPPMSWATIPQKPIDAIPAMLDIMIERIATTYLDAWLADDGALLDQYELPSNVLEQLRYYRPKVARWTAELQAGGWPMSIDHPDLNLSNALISADTNDLLIFDWEEIFISCPLFSLFRLLEAADDFETFPQEVPRTEGCLLLSPNQMAVRNAYLDALPWQSRAKRERAFDLAMCLAPIKQAYEEEQFCEAVGRTAGNPIAVARCFSPAIHYWQALTGVKNRA